MNGAFVTQVPRVQESFANEVVDESFLVLAGQLVVKRALIREFCQQLGGVAPHVGLDLAPADPAAGQRPVNVVVLDVSEVIFLDHDLYRHAEFSDVVKYRAMVTGDTPRSVIEVLAFVEITGAARSVHLRRRKSRA